MLDRLLRLLNQGVLPERIVLAGDSAGGDWVIALMLSLRDAAVPLPAAGVCFSPWTDLTLTGATLAANASTDFINRNVLAATAKMYLGNHDPLDPLVSPLFADLSGLPPLLIQAGTAEILLDDSRRLAARARLFGVPVELELWPDMMHVFQLTYLIEPRARAAVRSAGNFIRRRTPLRGVSIQLSAEKERVDAERTATGLFN
ncbi:MAG: alpha/beta hydrolase fold domain-containing protein [Anaerolineales bacterium]|nr:alpha/beta hydrolase fold domain-containing protein [Anaerolineales bacterium]